MAGRPREFDREQALLKARNLFWRQGYEGTSMSDLVAELGIASARIYKAFGSKEQLFREAIASYETAEGGFADRAFAQESGIRRRSNACWKMPCGSIAGRICRRAAWWSPPPPASAQKTTG